MRRRGLVLVALAGLACGSESAATIGSATASASGGVAQAVPSSSTGPGASSAAPGPLAPLDRTPNQLLAGGPVTFVVGTLGDDASDRSVRVQAELIRSLLPGATIVDDVSIDVAAGPAAWPDRPVLYGGAHVNQVVAKLASSLPLTADAEHIAVGGQRFSAPGARLIAVVPAEVARGDSPGHPDFLLYAGVGSPGIVEINNLQHGDDPILIGDAFGRLRAGRWARGADGTLSATLGQPAARPAWTTLTRPVAQGRATIAFPASGALSAEDGRVADAIARGLATAAARLTLAQVPEVSVYVYPDKQSKLELTGDGGAGHTNSLAQTLHVLRVDPSPDGPLERLVAHEGTHAFAATQWGPPGSALMGEGLAVWVSGSYGGKSLDQWAKVLGPRAPAASLLPMRAFRGKPEPQTYPTAGLLVAAAVKQVGLANVRAHLYGASASDWESACKRAGTTAAALDRAVAEAR